MLVNASAVKSNSTKAVRTKVTNQRLLCAMQCTYKIEILLWAWGQLYLVGKKRCQMDQTEPRN